MQCFSKQRFFKQWFPKQGFSKHCFFKPAKGLLNPTLLFAIVFAVVLTMAGCASGPSNTGMESDLDKMGTTQDAGRAVVTLVAKATKHEQQAQWERAAALLERALRIEPRNARLWHRLATIRLQQGRYGMAESLAEKSNALAGDNETLKRRNAELIEAARRSLAAG
jgi:cytochrome c-type biogenesis protein CcmH/NrfG